MNTQTKDATYRLGLIMILTFCLLALITPKLDITPSPLQSIWVSHGREDGLSAGGA
jgi:hypothetical protein